MATNIDESKVGIFCFISKLPGFRGILKQRYSDFIVNEVDREGNVVHLTSLDAPQEIGEETVSTIDDTTNTKSYASEIESFRSLAGDSDAKCLEDFINQINSGVQDDISPIVLSPDSDKSHRTAMHNFFKQNFKFLVTDVVDGPDASSKCIRVRLNTGGHNNRGRNSRKRKERRDKPFDSRGSENWSENNGKFLRFHLSKENKDTQEALGLIGKMLGIQPRSFGFAGTKDKRSVSTQRLLCVRIWILWRERNYHTFEDVEVSEMQLKTSFLRLHCEWLSSVVIVHEVTVFKQHASKLAALNERLIGIKVGDFCYVKEGLLLGQLLGNRFTVTLRGVVADSDDTVKASADALGRLGFINYFGLQRFGSGSVPTHLIGAALFRGEWKTVLQCLKKCPGNYLQALKAIPRTLRMMYVHSYQSYLWNHAASLRAQKYGTDQVVLGDLVYCKGDNTEKVSGGLPECEDDSYNDVDDSNHLDEISGTDLPEERNNLVKASPLVEVALVVYVMFSPLVQVAWDDIGIALYGGPFLTVSCGACGGKEFLGPLRVVTEEDILTGNYTIEDVVLPLPGSRVIYPSNDIANVFHELAKKDMNAFDTFLPPPESTSSLGGDEDAISLMESSHTVKEFSITSMTGSYRRVFQKPIDFEWELLSYTDGNIPLVETDLEKIAKSKPLKMVRAEDPANGNEENNQLDCTEQSEILENDMKLQTDDDEAEGEKEEVLPKVESQEPQMALKLSFTLPASCYATMAIRELLKTSTSEKLLIAIIPIHHMGLIYWICQLAYAISVINTSATLLFRNAMV
uniref:TRUD domain-containing protein n=1 Tax=Fagus sylvatica TaxID=28930 RepID=A0A2N9EI18_FAGSY